MVEDAMVGICKVWNRPGKDADDTQGASLMFSTRSIG